MRYLLSIALLIISAYSCLAEGPDKIKIGVSLPLSGDAMVYGIDMRNALMFANKKYANNQYDLIFEDDKCSGRDAATIAQKFANIDKVKFVIGYGCSGALLSAAPIFERAKILTIGVGTSSPEITSAGDYIFRTCPSDIAAGEILGNYLAKEPRNLAILSEETTFAQDLTSEIINQFKRSQAVVKEETFLPSATDFRPSLLRLKVSGATSILVIIQSEVTLLQIVKQLNQLNWKPTLYSAYSPGSPTFLKEAGALAEGIIYVDVPTREGLLTSDGLKDYDQFLKEYGALKSFDFFSVSAITAFVALHKAITSVGQNPTSDEVKNHFYEDSFTAPLKTFSFDAHGDIRGSLMPVIRMIKDGRPQVIAN